MCIRDRSQQPYHHCELVQTDFGKVWVPAGLVAQREVSSKSQRFQAVNSPLFPQNPSPNDVKQTNLGDCYLQSALMSVAGTNPAYIKNIMQDNGDDTVTVRLHKVNKDSTSFTPRYIKVNKSIPKSSKGKDLYNPMIS